MIERKTKYFYIVHTDLKPQGTSFPSTSGDPAMNSVYNWTIDLNRVFPSDKLIWNTITPNGYKVSINKLEIKQPRDIYNWALVSDYVDFTINSYWSNINLHYLDLKYKQHTVTTLYSGERYIHMDIVSALKTIVDKRREMDRWYRESIPTFKKLKVSINHRTNCVECRVN